MQDYLQTLRGIGPEDRPLSPCPRGICTGRWTAARGGRGRQRIRVHDLRHSAVSLLIDMGFSATAIADRVGHESIDITYHYAHLFPSKQAEMADKLNEERGDW